ncbi:MAG: RNA methyltransferase [Bacteroidales bacterium]|nr:RNA methyltransferase [Bacteroidales bacterium]MBN2818393.1 RNA methyltransferase [Bacteroidales bacterium]
MEIKDLIKNLEEFVTEERKNLFASNIKNRTRYLTVVLEDIFQPHNASAVLRTCDCFGVQDVHIIENQNEYDVNPDVALGSQKWLNLYKYNQKENNTKDAISKLKKSGYRIIATTPHTNDVELEVFNLNKGKAAILLGTELRGLSQEALELADEYLKIPMFGFTESFNISVSAAMILHFLTYKLRNSESINWRLSQQEQDEIRLEWLKTSIKDSENILKQLIEK